MGHDYSWDGECCCRASYKWVLFDLDAIRIAANKLENRRKYCAIYNRFESHRFSSLVLVAYWQLREVRRPAPRRTTISNNV